MSQQVLSVDAPTPCTTPAHRDAFEQIIDLTVGVQHKPDRRRLKLLTNYAKDICKKCPEREQCLTVHGPDLALGVVAGATDVERARMFGEATA